MSTGRVVASLAVLLVLSPVAASAVTIPFIFTNGTVADADQVNANFAALATAIDNIPAGPPGPAGPAGRVGPAGPAGPVTWVQLFDRNFTNTLTSTQLLNLSNQGINPNFTTGGFSLATSSITNDTLVFPGPGNYFVTIQLRASFLLPASAPTPGSVYQILFNILDGNTNSTLNSLVFNGIIPGDPNAVLDNSLSTAFVIHNDTDPPRLQIALSNFNFNVAFDNQLSVFDIIIVVQKW